MTRVIFTGHYALRHIEEIFNILKDIGCEQKIYEYIDDTGYSVCLNDKDLIITNSEMVDRFGLKTIANLKGLGYCEQVYCKFDNEDAALQFKLSLP